MRVKLLLIAFLTLALLAGPLIATDSPQVGEEERKVTVEGICWCWVYFPSTAKPGDWFPVRVRLKALREMDFIVSVRVIHGWGRFSDWDKVIDTHLGIFDEAKGTTAVKIPEDVETGPIYIWLDIGYSDINHYTKKGGEYYYVSDGWILTGPYVRGITP